jgi:hypothetical protein
MSEMLKYEIQYSIKLQCAQMDPSFLIILLCLMPDDFTYQVEICVL